VIRISSWAVALALCFTLPAFAEDNKPVQAPSNAAQSKDACRAKCEAQYNQDKTCERGVSPMHSVCEVYNLCLNDCD
jgi:hypothetical protein